MNPSLDTYRLSANVAKDTYYQLKEKIKTTGKKCVEELCQIGNDMIIQNCKAIVQKHNLVPHKNSNMYIAFPCCISVNNCVGYYHCKSEKERYNTISNGDVVKIEVGVNINGCISLYGDTFIYTNDKTDSNKNTYIKVLDKLEKAILTEMIPGNLNDDVRMKIESVCSNYNCFPVENTISYQSHFGMLKSNESKYIYANYQKYYDDDDELIGEPNMCFELLDGEMYQMNLVIVEDNEDTAQTHQYTELDKPHIYNINDFFYSLKLKSSKEFYTTIKSAHGNNAFYLEPYTAATPKFKLGFKEPYENGIIDEYPVMFTKDNCNVYFRKFMVIVNADGGIKLA